MKVSEIVKLLNEIASPSLAYQGEELGIVCGDQNKEIKIIGVTERPTVKVLQEAVNKKVDFLITHEPLYHSEKSMIIKRSLLSFPPNVKRKELVEKGGFVVYRYHSQWDDAEGGNNDVLADLLEIKVTEKIPYGRIGSILPRKLEELVSHIKKKLNTEFVLVVGNLEQMVNKVAVVAGSGNSMAEIMEYVKQKGAEVLISGDLTDGRARFAKEIRLSIIDAGDYALENPGAKRLAELLREKLLGINIIYLDPQIPWVIV